LHLMACLRYSGEYTDFEKSILMNQSGFEKVIHLFNIEDKRPAEKYCRDLVISSEDLFHIILAGRAGGMAPYIYACHFAESMPEHLHLTENDHSALRSNGVGPLNREATKSLNKITQTFKDRRMFAAHLFYSPSKKYWHLFYFDQRDLEAHGNHWKVGGPHIHYSRESFSNEPLEEVWRKICSKAPRPPKSIHVNYDYHHNRKKE